jgi:hypothetical protein
MTNNQRNTSTSRPREEPIRPVETVVRRVDAGTVMPVMSTNSAYAPARPLRAIVTPHTHRVRYVINVRTQDVKEVIRQANEVLQREETVIPTTAAEEEPR